MEGKGKKLYRSCRPSTRQERERETKHDFEILSLVVSKTAKPGKETGLRVKMLIFDSSY